MCIFWIKNEKHAQRKAENSVILTEEFNNHNIIRFLMIQKCTYQCFQTFKKWTAQKKNILTTFQSFWNKAKVKTLKLKCKNHDRLWGQIRESDASWWSPIKEKHTIDVFPHCNSCKFYNKAELNYNCTACTACVCALCARTCTCVRACSGSLSLLSRAAELLSFFTRCPLRSSHG